MIDESVFSEKRGKNANQTPAGATFLPQLLNPVQLICNSSANISVPVDNDIGNQWCSQAAAVQPMANHLLKRLLKVAFQQPFGKFNKYGKMLACPEHCGSS